jgi:hypothetical protein
MASAGPAGRRKKVLVRSPDTAHQLLYEKGLAKYFDVDCERMSEVDAVVLDLPFDPENWEELLAVFELGVPMVLLTPLDALALPDAANLRIISYPATILDVKAALEELGI